MEASKEGAPTAMTHAVHTGTPDAPAPIAAIQDTLSDYWQVLKRYHAAPVTKRPHLLRNQVWLRWRGETHAPTRERLRQFIDTEHTRLKSAYGVTSLTDLAPGSRPARDWGCRCPHAANEDGAGFQGSPHLKVIADACPLHGREMWRLPT